MIYRIDSGVVASANTGERISLLLRDREGHFLHLVDSDISMFYEFFSPRYCAGFYDELRSMLRIVRIYLSPIL